MKQKQALKGKKKDVIMAPGWIRKQKKDTPDSIKEDELEEESPDSKKGGGRSRKLRFSRVTEA